MPELPEVQTTVNGLNRALPKLIIKDVWSDYYLRTKNRNKNTIKDKKYFEYFRKKIIGEKVIKAERRAKNVLINLTNNKTILVHMKMTGHFLYGNYVYKNGVWKSDDRYLSDSFNKFIHLVFNLSNKKCLAFSDMRKFAKVFLFETNEKDNIPDLKNLGPEPLQNLSLPTFKKQLLKKPNGKIKTVLMDQTIIAGIGNIYSDEILWTTAIHPERKVFTLNNTEMKNVWQATKKILSRSIKMGGDSMSDYRNVYGKKGKFQEIHRVYRKTKEKCSKKNCCGIIQRKIIGNRSSHFCDTHQK